MQASERPFCGVVFLCGVVCLCVAAAAHSKLGRCHINPKVQARAVAGGVDGGIQFARFESAQGKCRFVRAFFHVVCSWPAAAALAKRLCGSVHAIVFARGRLAVGIGLHHLGRRLVRLALGGGGHGRGLNNRGLCGRADNHLLVCLVLAPTLCLILTFRVVGVTPHGVEPRSFSRAVARSSPSVIRGGDRPIRCLSLGWRVLSLPCSSSCCLSAISASSLPGGWARE
mmetsp:Transcript_6207/g.11036  ORF Transcript_6207/g.11036 Transcript_6207/m.11036 type:complete len:227 (+) Transcript_6207:341-1021(+)